MKIKLFVGLWLVLIVFVMVSICNALTETQIKNNIKQKHNADYMGNAVVKENDGGICRKEVKVYVKYATGTDKSMRAKTGVYYTTPDNKAWESK